MQSAVLMPVFIGWCLLGRGWAEGLRPGSCRLALVELRGETPVPATFASLLFVELGKNADIHLLERGEIAKVLQEQELGLMTRGTVDAKSAIQAGKILSAAALLILELENHSKTPLLRTRLVDTRYGLKLFDGSLALPEKPDDYETLARQLARRVVRHLQHINVDRDQLLPVGVSSFLSEELSPKWNWLSDEIPKAIEQNMGLYPGVVLLERKATRPLSEERELASGLPESLRASAILINGSYRIVDGGEAVMIRLRARRQAVTLAEEIFHTPLDTVGTACAQAAKTLFNQLRSSQVGAPMNAEDEAEMLATEARTHLDRNEPDRALPAAEAALALVPDSFAYMGLVIRSMTSRGEVLCPFNKDGDPRDTFPHIWRLLNMARTMMRKCPLPPRAGPGPKWTDEEWQRHLIHLQARGFVSQYLRPKKDARYYDGGPVDIFYDDFWNFFEEARVRYAERPRLLAGLIRGFTSQSGGLRRAGNIEEAIRKADELVPLETHAHRVCPQKSLDPLHTIVEFYGAFITFREADREAGVKGLAYLEQLMQSPDAYVRMEASRYGLRYYTTVDPNLAKRRQLAATYVEASKEEGRPNPKPILGLTYHEDPDASQQIEMGFVIDLIEHALANDIAFDWYHWKEAIFKVGFVLDSKEGPARALEFYESVSAAAACEDWKARVLWHMAQNKIAMLKADHPELADNGYPADMTAPVLLLRTEDISLSDDNKTVDFSRLSLQDDQTIVIFTPARTPQNIFYQSMFGAVRFNADSGEVMSVVEARDIRHGQWKKPTLSRNRRPHVVNVAGDLTLGNDYAGIATICADGSLKTFNTEIGLPCTGVHSFAQLPGRLFYVAGSAIHGPQALVEMDIETGVTTIICSSREDPAENESHRIFIDLVADSRRNLLWFISRIRYSEYKPHVGVDRLYRYDPETGELKRISVPDLDIHLTRTNGALRMFGDSLLIDGFIGLCEFNVETQETRLLCAHSGRRNEQGEWSKPFPSIGPTHFTLVEDGIVSISSGKLIHFQFGRKDAIIYPVTMFRRPTTRRKEEAGVSDYDRYFLDMWRCEVLDFTPSPKGLFVITRNALWLVPEIRAAEEE